MYVKFLINPAPFLHLLGSGWVLYFVVVDLRRICRFNEKGWPVYTWYGRNNGKLTIHPCRSKNITCMSIEDPIKRVSHNALLGNSQAYSHIESISDFDWIILGMPIIQNCLVGILFRCLFVDSLPPMSVGCGGCHPLHFLGVFFIALQLACNEHFYTFGYLFVFLVHVWPLHTCIWIRTGRPSTAPNTQLLIIIISRQG